MRRIIPAFLCFLVFNWACKKEDAPRITRIRFENQSMYNFSYASVQTFNAKQSFKLGAFAIGATSEYIDCDTLYRNFGYPKFGSFFYNPTSSPTVIYQDAQPSRPYPVTYEMVEPGDYTIVITSFYNGVSPDAILKFSFK